MKYCPCCGHTIKCVKQDETNMGSFSYFKNIYKHDPELHPDECDAVWYVESNTMDQDETVIYRTQ